MNSPQSRTAFLGVLFGGVLLASAGVLSDAPASKRPVPTVFTNTTVFTNKALLLSPVQWRRAIPRPTTNSLDGIEAAERINAQLMRRNREQWQQSHGRQ